MPRYESSLKISSFNSKITRHFLNRFSLMQLKNRLTVQLKGARSILKKNTILRSPHVNKKARDQIQVSHISRFFLPVNSFNWFAFLRLYTRLKNDEIEFDYKYQFSKKFYLTFNIKK